MDFFDNEEGYVLITRQGYGMVPEFIMSGTEIFLTLDDAKASHKSALMELHQKAMTSEYHAHQLKYGAFGLNAEKPEIFKVKLVNGWLYDTEPIKDGTRYSLKIRAKALPLLEYDQYDSRWVEHMEFSGSASF